MGESITGIFFRNCGRCVKKLAESAHVPPFVVFSDRTLHEMARHYPTTDETMLAISGVGEMKLRKYGAAFMTVIEAFCRAHPNLFPPAQLPN